MRSFFGNTSFKGDHGRSVLAIFFSIFAYTFISIQINSITQNSISMTNTINLLQAIGILVTGFFSDLFSRRTVHFVVQIMGLFFLVLLLLNPTNLFVIVLLSLLYNPLSLLRATLIDNLPHVSKMQLVALSFLVAKVMQGVYYESLKLSALFSITACIWVLGVSLLISAFFFFDKREIAKTKHVRFPLKEFTNKGAKKRFTFTLIAFLCAQAVFFLIDNASVRYVNSPLYLSVASVAYVCGALLVLFYKKTPHTSVLTVNYGLCTISALVPIICIHVYGFKEIDVPIHFVIFSAMTFFALPFTYDIILNATHANFRGLTCGILDFVYTAMTFINPAVNHYFRHSALSVILFLIFGLFAIAMMIQKRAEEGAH